MAHHNESDVESSLHEVKDKARAAHKKKKRVFPTDHLLVGRVRLRRLASYLHPTKAPIAEAWSIVSYVFGSIIVQFFSLVITLYSK